jgi:DNA modification methylase
MFIKLNSHEKNPRVITSDQKKRLEKNILDFGDLSGIVFNTLNNKLVGGHMRTSVFKKVKSKIEIIKRNESPDPQGTVAIGFLDVNGCKYFYREVYFSEEDHEKAMLIANKAGGDWDWDKLHENWDKDWLKDEIGFNDDDFGDDHDVEIIENTEADDDVPEGAPPITVLGDIYELGGAHRVMCGDSTMIDEVERLMDGNKADMVFTDPPYGVSYTEKAKNVLKSKEYVEIKNDDKSGENLKSFFYDVFSTIVQIMKEDCSYYVCSPQGGDSEMMMMMMMREAGMKCRHQIIWVKDSPVFSMGRLDYDYKHEPILYGWVKKHKFQRKGSQDKSVWEFSRTENKLHPTMKPVELVQNAIMNSSIISNNIFDSFLGSGSTLIACEKTNRKCYGLELDPKYCDTIVKRYVDFCKKNDKPYSVVRNGETCNDFG